MSSSKREQFGVIGTHYCDEVDKRRLACALEHYERSESLQDLIFGWITNERSVTAVNADCDPGEEDGFIIELKEKADVLLQVIVSMNWLRGEFAVIPPATAYDDELEGVTNKEYCDIVADYTNSEEDIMKVMASYLFAEYSQIIFDSGGDWMYDECSEEELKAIEGKQLILVSPFYNNPDTKKGFGEHRWALRSIEKSQTIEAPKLHAQM